MWAGQLIESCEFFMGSLGGILLWVVCTGTCKELVTKEEERTWTPSEKQARVFAVLSQRCFFLLK